MPGSYIVNESVKGRSSSGPNQYSSYRRCLCLIATIFVFTVATIVVLLALNSDTGSGNSDIEPKSQRITAKQKMIFKSTTPSTINYPRVVYTRKQNLRRPNEIARNRPSSSPREHSTSGALIRAPTTTARASTKFVGNFREGEMDSKQESLDQDQLKTHPWEEVTEISHEKVQTEVRKALLRVHPEPNTTEGPISTLTATETKTTRAFRQTQPPINLSPLPSSLKCAKSCATSQCGKSLADLVMKIDFDTDPCDDFYKFSCNGLVLNQIATTTSEEAFRLQIQKYVKADQRTEPFLAKYKTFYDSCMQFKCDGSTDPVVKFFKPYMTGNANEIVEDKTHKLTTLIGRILLDGRLSSRVIPLFDIDLEFQSQFEAIPVLTMPVSPPLLQTAHSDDLYVANCKQEAEEFAKNETSAAKIYDHYEGCLNNYTMYIKVLEKSMRIFEIFNDVSEFEREQELLKTLTTIEWDVLDVIKRLSDAEIVAEKKDPSSGLLMTVAELSSACPAVDWDTLFPVLFDGKVERVKVRFNKRFQSLCEFYKSKDFNLLKNIILSMLAHDWYVEFMRPTVIADRVAYCERLSNNLMQDVVSNVFMAHAPIAQLREFEAGSGKLLDQLKQTLIADIEQAGWLSADERGEIILAIDRLQTVPNYPELLGKEANVLSNMVLYMSETDFVANVLVLKRRTRTIYRNFKDLPEATLFSNLFNPLATKVQFIEGKNVIFVPLPLVNRFVNGKVHLADQQKYEIYSKLGFLIGQALLERLNPKRLRSLVKMQDNEALNFYEDFSLAEPPILGFTSAGLDLEKASVASSTSSRFGDDGGVRLVLGTYQRFNLFDNADLPLFTLNGAIRMTYFLNVAQQFCSAAPMQVHQMAIDSYTKDDLPGVLRVNNMMANSAEFAKTFDCAVGSTMNPLLKSQQFPFIDSSS